MFRLIPFFTAVLCALTSLTAKAEITASVNDQSFMTEGYATVTLSLQDATLNPSVGPVVWKVERVVNAADAITDDFKERKTGLTWNQPAYTGVADIGEYKTEIKEGGSRAVLIDVLGERTLTVTAQWSVNGEVKQETVEVKTGKGPISRFQKPYDEKITWLEFYKRCNGKDFDGNAYVWFWKQPSAGGKMPTLMDMQSVSGPGKYNPTGKGAAVAAGWKTDARYWSGDVVMPRNAAHVDITTGSPHGHGGQRIDTSAYAARLKE